MLIMFITFQTNFPDGRWSELELELVDVVNLVDLVELVELIDLLNTFVKVLKKIMLP